MGLSTFACRLIKFGETNFKKPRHLSEPNSVDPHTTSLGVHVKKKIKKKNWKNIVSSHRECSATRNEDAAVVFEDRSRWRTPP